MIQPRLIEFQGECHSVSAWARKIGIDQSSLSERLLNGWPLEKALGPKTRTNHILNESTKCTNCGRIFPWSVKYFKAKRKKGCGCEQPCKQCYQSLHRDRRSRSRKLYYQNHIEKERATARQWYRDTRKERLAYAKTRYTTNPELAREKSKMWAKNNPIKRRFREHRRRVRIKEAMGSLTKRDIDIHYTNQRGRCWWCSKKLNGVYQIDHRIPLSRGGKHDKANIVLACQHCNDSKGSKLPHEWIGRLL